MQDRGQHSGLPVSGKVALLIHTDCYDARLRSHKFSIRKSCFSCCMKRRPVSIRRGILTVLEEKVNGIVCIPIKDIQTELNRSPDTHDRTNTGSVPAETNQPVIEPIVVISDECCQGRNFGGDHQAPGMAHGNGYHRRWEAG